MTSPKKTSWFSVGSMAINNCVFFGIGFAFDKPNKDMCVMFILCKTAICIGPHYLPAK